MPSVEAYKDTHPHIDQEAENERMKDLNPRFIKDDINGTSQSRQESERIGPRGSMRRGDDTFEMKLSYRSDKNSKYHQTNSYDSLKRNNFSDKEESPDLGEERCRARDGVDQREIGHSISLNEADEIDGLDEARSERDSKDFEGELTEKDR